jgi:nuclear GTP-binding protein
MVKKKGKSKRTTLKDKNKIQKRTVQTHRKNRKQAKKDVANGVVQHNKKKDPGIPNSWPFKADLLKEIQRTRERQQALQQTKKEQRADQLRALRQHQAEGGTARTVEELAQMAGRMRDEYAAATSAAEIMSSGGGGEEHDGGGKAGNGSAALGQQSRRAYLRELKKVVDASDVLLQVLDARDPVGTRLGAMAEDAILSHSDKRMVLVLNKIDLVPKEVVGAWLAHLRKSHPTIALQANKVASSKSKGNNSASGGTNDDDNDDDNATMATAGTTSNSTSTSSLTSGMDGLLQLLKNYARTSGGGKNSKTNIVVGVGTSGEGVGLSPFVVAGVRMYRSPTSLLFCSFSLCIQWGTRTCFLHRTR